MKAFITFLIFTVTPYGCFGESLVRDTASGQIKGELRSNKFNQEENYYAFHAIPYGKPPINSDRFQRPQPAESWTEVLDASDSNEYKCCYQPEDGSPYNMDEDCLRLSVYSPVATPGTDNKLPVVVWIHGGSFVSGCGMYPFYGPDKIMKGNDVVMVSINYRVGMFGFLSLADEKLSGNMGLQDQHMALQWVQNNIHNFGGDPNQVTIWGESAGSWSVFYQMMSPYEQTFQQIIGSSGSVVSPAWYEYTAEDAKRWGQKTVEALGCNMTENIEDQVECLQTLDPISILNCPVQVGHMGPIAVVDSSFSDDPFLPDHPRNLIEDGNYHKDTAVLLGSNRDDGLLSTFPLIAFPSQLGIWRENWKYGVGAYNLFGIEPQFLNEKVASAVDKITNFYLGDVENMNIQHIDNITQMLTDSVFAYGAHDFITRHLPNAKDDSIFQYVYAHQGANSILMAYGAPAPFGVCHADDLYMLFDPLFVNWIPEEGLNNADSSVSDTMIELWKNFIKTGNPSTQDVEWDPINDTDDNDRKYLWLTDAESSLMEYPKEWKNRMEIWDEVMEELLAD